MMMGWRCPVWLLLCVLKKDFNRSMEPSVNVTSGPVMAKHVLLCVEIQASSCPSVRSLPPLHISHHEHPRVRFGLSVRPQRNCLPLPCTNSELASVSCSTQLTVQHYVFSTTELFGRSTWDGLYKDLTDELWHYRGT